MDTEELFEEQAKTLIKLKRYSEALEKAKLGLASYPQSYYLHYLASIAYLNSEKIDESEEHIRSCINLNPEIGLGFYIYSEILHKKCNFAGELKMAEEAVRLDPEDADYLQRLISAQSQNGLLKKARETAQQLVKLDPNSEAAHEELAGIYIQLEQWEGAESHYRLALNINPENIIHLYNLAAVVKAQGRSKEAIDILWSTAKLDPTQQDIQKALIKAINSYLPSPLFVNARKNKLNELPSGLVNYYLDHNDRLGIIGRHNGFVMVVGWSVVLILMSLIFSPVFK